MLLSVSYEAPSLGRNLLDQILSMFMGTKVLNKTFYVKRFVMLSFLKVLSTPLPFRLWRKSQNNHSYTFKSDGK